MDNLAIIQLIQSLLTGHFGEIPDWLAANWYGIITTVLTIGFFFKHQAAKSLIRKSSNLVYKWRIAKKDKDYNRDELVEIGEEFVALADELEERVKKGLFTNRSK